ncbi:MAG TPA: aminoacetone oxidase family FAD-binding enzyme [Opitutae bacterium]|nr:aminoacetone oxidase family FAD-binding enzyme [Opitutae bacterium]
MNDGKKTVVIIGGGAAGHFAAITAAQTNPSLRVILLEAGSQVLRKVKISGGGKCNLTHHCFDPKELSTKYPRGARELRGAFYHWQPKDTIEWFEQRGVKTKVEEDGRMFPVTDNSQTVINCLRSEASKYGISERLNSRVTALRQVDNQWELELNGKEFLIVDKVCLALGSLKQSGLEGKLNKLGHTVSPLLPSLFAFNLPSHPLKDLAGVAVQHAAVRTSPKSVVQVGPVLITHRGLSGPAILRASAWDARELAEVNYQFTADINWLGEKTKEQILIQLTKFRKERAVKKLKHNPFSELSKRLWEKLVELSGIDPETTWAHLSKEAMTKLLNQLTAHQADVSGKTMNKEEFVTCGGVNLKEVDFRTMESKFCTGLHFAGECLDLDGITGGFNFQAAWTTGRIAGLAMVTNL